MTPVILLAILLILGLVLCVLLTNIVRQLRSGKDQSGNRPSEPASSSSVQDVADESHEPNPVPEQRLPRVAGRKRQLKALSEGGGDPSAVDKLMDSSAYASCERRLEQAFEVYSHGRISLETYETMVRAEGERAKRLRAEFRAKELAGQASAQTLDDLREEIETIEIAVQWCLDWAEDLRKAEPAEARDNTAGEN